MGKVGHNALENMVEQLSGRKLRLHKKLRTGPFQQLGFEISFAVGESDVEAFVDGLIELVEENGFLFSGNSSGGFVVPRGRASATQVHRDIFEHWLAGKPQVSTFSVGPLKDAWHEPA